MIHVSVHVPDTVAHVVDRQTLANANFAIVSRDGTAAFLLLRANGDEVFRDTEIGHGPLMEAFTPSDAKAFAAKAREARVRLR